MRFVIMLLFIFLPFIDLFLNFKIINKLEKISDEEKEILKELRLFGKFIGLKKQIVDIYVENKYKKSQGELIAKIFIKIRNRIIIHYIIGFLGSICIVYNIYEDILMMICKNFEINKLSYGISLNMIMIVIWIIFYLKPIINSLGLKRLNDAITMELGLLFGFINKMMDRLSFFSGKILCFFLFLGYFIIMKYLYAFLVVCKILSKNDQLLWYIIFIGIYQLILNKYICKYIVNKFFDKYLYPEADLIFSMKLQSTYNYYYLIIILAWAYIMGDNADPVIFSSTTVIFLLDTYINNHKNIIEEYRDEHKKEI